MDHYRLTVDEAGLPFPALAFPSSDLAPLGGPVAAGFATFEALTVQRVEIPHVDLSADMHRDASVTVYYTRVPGESGAMVRYDFPQSHGAWGEAVHEAGGVLVCAVDGDFAAFPTLTKALEASYFGRATLVLRATIDGIGTHGPR